MKRIIGMVSIWSFQWAIVSQDLVKLVGLRQMIEICEEYASEDYSTQKSLNHYVIRCKTCLLCDAIVDVVVSEVYLGKWNQSWWTVIFIFFFLIFQCAIVLL